MIEDRSILEAALIGYQYERDKIDAKIAEIRSELGVKGAGVTQATSPTRPTKRVMSASARRRIAAAQRKRWAAVKAAKPAKLAKPPAAKKRKMSAAGRKRIAEATRKRWAEFRRAKKAAGK